MVSYILSSDLLERQFGEVKAEVLLQTDRKRVICSRVVATGQILELADVTFNPQTTVNFADIHTEIRAGGMMGKTFRAHGVAFNRQTTAEFLWQMPPSVRQFFGVDGQFATVVVVMILVGDDRQQYSCNIEVYSPAVNWPLTDAGDKQAEQEARSLLRELATQPFLSNQAVAAS